MRIAKNHLFADLISDANVVFHTKMGSGNSACCKVMDLRAEIGAYVVVLMLFTGTFIELPLGQFDTFSAARSAAVAEVH